MWCGAIRPVDVIHSWFCEYCKSNGQKEKVETCSGTFSVVLQNRAYLNGVAHESASKIANYEEKVRALARAINAIRISANYGPESRSGANAIKSRVQVFESHTMEYAYDLFGFTLWLSFKISWLSRFSVSSAIRRSAHLDRARYL